MLEDEAYKVSFVLAEYALLNRLDSELFWTISDERGLIDPRKVPLAEQVADLIVASQVEKSTIGLHG